MKKLLALFFAVLMLFTLCACTEGEDDTTSTIGTTKTTTSSISTQPTSTSTKAEPVDLDSIFKYYPPIINDLGCFDTVDELTAYQVFVWCRADFEPCKTDSYWDTENYIDVIHHYYDASEINARTLKYLGRTWDYSGIVKTSEYDEANYSYDTDSNCVVVTHFGASGDPSEDSRLKITYNGYTSIDSTHFEINYNYYMRFGPELATTRDYVISVELKGSNYIITSHRIKK